jgi:hypothetical protein
VSTQEIIAELPKLTRPELEAVEARLQQLLGRPPVRLWGEALAGFAGVVQELPADYASNHDHYLHGTPKR